MTRLDPVASHLPASARERLKQGPVRIVLAFIIAWGLTAAGRADLVAPWLAINALVQLFEYLAMRPYRRAGEPPRSAPVVLTALSAVVAMSGAYAGLAAVLWMSGLPVLAATGVLILCGGLMNNVASAVESRRLFLIGATPYLVSLLFLPAGALMQGRIADLPLLVVAVVLFIAGILGVWSRTHEARLAAVQARAEAEARLAQAEAAMADRAAMAAIVSHELRTPVSAILAGAHVIRHGEQPDKTVETADLIVDAGRLMTSMLNDLLDHSKIEARAMTLEARDFDVAACAADAARFWAAPAEAKGLALKVSAPDAPAWVKGDPYRLRQIVNNLISNAVKFTPKGAVGLEVETHAVPEGRRLVITVRDQGPGIAPDAMWRLFTPFAQGSAEVARTYGGTGLGLAVSRDLARLMGGDLTAENLPGQGGAAFRLEVTLPEGEPVEAKDDFDAPAPTLERRLRVLAVDDHEINRRTLALVLQPLDVDLATAVDGESALALLAAQPFDVVLMDVNMPGVDGNEATRRLRASGGLNAEVPVIGFSAGTEAAQVEACRAAGMTDWLPKPLEPKRLYDALQRAVAAPPDAAGIEADAVSAA